MTGTGNRLSALTKELLAQWSEAKSHWDDAKSGEFERKYLQELVAGVDRSVTVIEQLDKLFAKIRKDCE